MSINLQAVSDPATDQNFRQLAQRFPLQGGDVAGVLKLVSGEAKVAFGSGAWIWPGANKFSNKLKVTHGLGTTPRRIVITPTDAGGAALTYSAFSKTSTTFETWAGDWLETPVAGQEFAFDWIAIG